VVAVKVVIPVVTVVIAVVAVVVVVIAIPDAVVEGDAPPVGKHVVVAVAESGAVMGPDAVVEVVVGDDVDAAA
jgi:hypothetical protein